MKIRYLGTAAAEGAPALFCTCDHCAYARKVGGKEIRSRAGSILDDRLKIDFGPDSFMQMIQNHIDYTPLKSILGHAFAFRSFLRVRYWLPQAGLCESSGKLSAGHDLRKREGRRSD